MSGLERRARELFLDALERAPEERSAFVAERSGADAALAARVESLLASDRALAARDTRGERFLEQPLAAVLDPGTPEQVGPYRLGERLGAGGMGVVHAATDARDGRRVAVKLLRPDVASEEALRRFRQEAALLARFTHEGIASALDAGTVETALGPRPWYAMELVLGVELDEWARAARPPLPERLELFARVCDAVEHAHGHGVVHRDLKPSNVVVRADLRPKVLDFGVARVTDELATRSMHTLAGDVLGTVAYMSPEQLAGGAHEADARSDVYSLGVMLHELLCGELPYDLADKNPFEAARAVRELEPTKPSRHDSRLRGDLDTIVAKALEKAPARRYASAGELAGDLRRHLAREPIRARPPSAVEHISRLARRHPAVSAAALALVLGGALALAQWVRARESSIRASAREREAELERATARAAAYRTQLAAAARALEDGDGAALRHALDRAPAERRGFEWRALDHLADGSRLAVETLPHAPARPRLSHDGLRVEALRARDEVAAWRLSDGAVARSWRASGDVLAFAVSPDGATCLVATAEGIALVDAADAGGRVRWRAAPAAGLGAAFDPAGRWVALPDAEGAAIRLLALADGRLLRELSLRHPVRRVDAGGGGALLLVTDASGAARVVESESGRTRWITGPGGSQLARDGMRVALASPTEGLVRVCDLRSGLPLEDVPAAKVLGGAWAVTEDGRRIACATASGYAVRDARDGRVSRALLGLEPDLVAIAFAPGGERLVSASAGGLVRVWDVADDAQRPHVAAVLSDPRARAWAIARDGGRIAYGTWGGATLVDARTGEPLWSRTVSRGPTDAVAFSPDGREVAAGMVGGTVAVFDATDGTLARELRVDVGREELLSAVAWSESGELVCATGTGSVRALDASGRERPVWEAELGHVRASGTGPGGLLALGGEAPGGGAAFAYGGTGAGSAPRTLRTGGKLVESVAFSHDGGSLATGCDDGIVRVWRVADAALVRELEGAEWPTGVAWSRDGSRLAAASKERDLVLWDPREVEPLCVLRAGRDRPLGVFVDWIGERLVTGGGHVYLQAFETAIDDATRDERRAVALAWERVEELSRVHPTSSAVDAALALELEEARTGESSATLSTDLLARARAQNRARGDNYNMLNSMAWGIACYAGRSPAEYARALAYARRASELCPDDWHIGNTLTVALLRAGEDAEALAAATRCHRLREATGLGPHPADVAIEVLALGRLERWDEARSRLEYATALASDPRWQGDEDARTFLAEATAGVRDRAHGAR